MTRENSEKELWYSRLFDKNQNAPLYTLSLTSDILPAGQRLVFGSGAVLKQEASDAAILQQNRALNYVPGNIVK